METPVDHWKYGLDIPLDTDERIAIQLQREKNAELAKAIKVDDENSI